jgi:hypothetical protein
MSDIANSPAKSARPFLEGLPGLSARFVEGVVLLVSFAVVFLGVLFLISALSLQHSVQTNTDPQTPATIGAVRLDIATLDSIDEQSAALTDQLNALRAERAAHQKTVIDQETKMLILRGNVKSIVRSVVAKYPYDPAVSGILPKLTANLQDWQTLGQSVDSLIEEAKAKEKAAPPETDAQRSSPSFVAELSSAVSAPLQDFTLAKELYVDASSRDQADGAAEDKLHAQLANIAPAGRLKDPSYRSVVEDFRAFKWLVGSHLFDVVLVPNTMLVLMLSIFMGMLGSLIYLAREMILFGEIKKPSEMLFRIGLGAAVALSLYFFASAGVLALSQSSAGQGNSDMSPYLISFLGITAGYLSDRVTAWMRDVGERTFKLEETKEPDRWGVGLAQQIAQQNLATDQIAAGIGSDRGEVQAWIDRRKPVPGAMQPLLSAYLRVHPFALFTDIKPESVP